MKKYILIIGVALSFSFLVSCNVKAEDEGEAFNPYDTSDMEARDASDTIYSMDSIIKSIRLRELK